MVSGPSVSRIGLLDPRVAAVLLALVLGGALVGCGDGPTAGTQTPTPLVGLEGKAAATLRITVEDFNSGPAIASVSTVLLEATTDNGAKLQFERIEFGDGASETQPIARHVYKTRGRYQATAIFRAWNGDEYKVSQPVVVKDVTGGWYHAAYNVSSHRFEVRRLRLTQNGTAIRGTLDGNDGKQQAVTGTVSPSGAVSLSGASQALEGGFPWRPTDEAVSWLLHVRGGTADGQTLPFTAFDEPTGAAPVADLKVIGLESYILEGLDVRFDASASAGDTLTYFVDYGDGAYSSERTSIHAPETDGEIEAQLTVVDRFGRYAIASKTFVAETLVLRWSYLSYHYWQHVFRNPSNRVWETREMAFWTQKGRMVSGELWQSDVSWYDGVKFTGTLSGARDIHLTFEDGVEFTGTVISYPVNGMCYQGRLLFQVRGGTADGQVLEFHVEGY